MPVPAADTAMLTDLLSPERLGALLTLTGSAEAAIELHQETLQVGAALMVVTATVEIALRNAVCETLAQHFAVPNWLQQPPVTFRWRPPEAGKITKAIDDAKRDTYAKLDQAGKGALDALAYPKGRPPNTPHLKRAKDRRRNLQVSHGKVVAELTLYFWKRLYGPEYEQTLWRTALKRTFPDKALKRAEVAVQLEHIYQSRNRLAHHEPVLHKRFADTVAAVEFVAQRLGMRKPDVGSPLAELLAGDLAQAKARAAALHAKLDAFRPPP